MSRVSIVQRVVRDGVTIRLLACGHEQEESPSSPYSNGNKPADARYAFCRPCSVEAARAAQTPREPPSRPVDARSELQRLADDVDRLFPFPSSAWGPGVVAVKKLADAARKHACSKTTEAM